MLLIEHRAAKARWYRVVTRPVDGRREAQHVLCHPDDMAESYPADLYYPPRSLDREPGEADVFRARQLQRCDETAARIKAEARLARMTHVERMNEAIAEAKRQMREEGA